jgi:hypothetical protein
MFDAFLSKQGIRSLRVGGPIVSLLEAAAQSDMRNAQDIFNLLTSADLDNATGLALSRIGRGEGIPKLEITPSAGVVTLSDTSFTKKATRLFQGAPAPIVGTGVVTPINVVDASSFPAPGPTTKIYIGRGTNNYEGPIRYTALVNVGNHWEITLATATTRFHNTSETVILAQGDNRTIGPNTVVRTPQASVASAIDFRTLYSVTLPDGETEVSNIQVVAQLGGQIGNVIAGAISEFSTSPFNGAKVTNPRPFTNGRETESDDDYRERIRNVRASRQLATTLAITTAVTGITAFDENKRINSASLVKRFGFPATLYIDDGTGYEERTANVSVESLMDDAVGGETHFETTQRPIARAFAITTNVAPFVLRSTDQLSVKVGGTTYTHSFNADDFHSISNASAFEVVASINSNPDIAFVARTAEQGSKVIVFANADTNEDIEIVENQDGTNANAGLAFPAGVNYTMRLYKNDRLLVKDGVIAVLRSQPFATWNNVSGPQTFAVAIDGTPSLTYTFEDQDFIDANTGYATLGRNSLAAWAAVVNAKIPGITATVNAGKLVLTSNAGPVSRAAVEISGGSLVAAHFFEIGVALGAHRDYTLDRNEAQVVLSQILEAGDRLTAGSFATRAFVESEDMTTVSLASDAHLWWLVDGSANIIEHGVTPTTSLDIAVAKTEDFGNLVTIAAGSAVFANVQPQDWMVLWDSVVPTTLRGVHRVADASSTSITIERHTSLTSRHGHRSVRIPGIGTAIGQIFTCGGAIKPRNTIALTDVPDGVVGTAELYDHNTQITTPAAPMNMPRAFHTATVLANGKVVVVGGVNGFGVHTGTIETYDPVADTWTTSAVSTTTQRKNHTATLLTDGRILIAGGDNGGAANNKFQIYDPSGDTITSEGTMVKHRSHHCAVKLPDDTVLIAGGFDDTVTDLVDAERFTPGPDTTVATGSMSVARSCFGMSDVEVTPTKVIAAGGKLGGIGADSWELYTIGAGTWGGGGVMNVNFEHKPLVKLKNGHVVGLNAYTSDTPTEYAAFTYDGTTFTELHTPIPPSCIDQNNPRWDSEYVELLSGDGTTVANLVASIGGSFVLGGSFGYQATSVLNVYDEPDNTWSAPEPATVTNMFLTDVGIAFVRSDAFVQDTLIPSGGSYTANSLADVFNAELIGATASVYKTTKLRVNTNTFDDTGDIAFVTRDVTAEAILLDPASATKNLVPHLGAVMSAGSDLGTPSFEDVRVVSQEDGDPHSKPVVTSTVIGHDYAIVGLKNLARGTDGGSPYSLGVPFTNLRANSNFKFATRLKTRVVDGDLVSTLETRDAPPQVWGPWDRVVAAAPFAISPNGNLEVLVDNDNDKRYPINLWRTLQTVGSTYGSSNVFRDGDDAGLSLAATFGLDYDFNDMAIYMASRVVAFPADAARRMVLRYFRLGPDGDGVRLRFGNPDAPSTNLKVVTVLDNSNLTNVTIKLKSGAPRTPTIHNTTRVGRGIPSITGGGTATFVEVLNLAISSASRTGGFVTAFTALPAGITNNGFNIGDRVWVQSTDINFSSGLKTLTAATAGTIGYAESAADQGITSNIGTVSYDSQGESSFTGSGTVALDFYRLNDPTNLVSYGNATFQVSSVPAGGHHIFVLSGDQIDGASQFVDTALTWVPIVSTAYLQVFANSPQTAGAIATAIQALRTAVPSTNPISAKETGTGLNNISQNTCDELDASEFWYILHDGVNWVKTTTLPLLISDDYTLEFKAPVTGALSTNSDWENEEVRIVPITTKNIVEWLNTPTVTGLWTVADIEAAGAGHHVQLSTLTAGSDGGVQVQGGLANSVTAPVVGSPVSTGGSSAVSTVSLLDADGFTSGMWFRIQNENQLPKPTIVAPGLILNSWDSAGLMVFSTPIFVENVSPTQLRVQFERQGQFVAIADTGSTDDAFFGSIPNGSWLRVSPATAPTIGQVQAANQGIFRVLRSTGGVGGTSGTIYIENPICVEETSECLITVFIPDSVMPGDQLAVLDPTWGVNNMGIWTVKAVGETVAGDGDVFNDSTTVTVDVSARTPVPQGASAALTSTGVIYLREGVPGVFVMRADGISPNQDDGNFVNIRWDHGIDSSSISESAGSVITVLDKLNFPQGFSAGSDGYRYDVGLLREANKVVYGDPGNPVTYPGVAAADSQINIQGPLVKRIQVGLSIRVKTGLNTQDIANRVRSAVATVVNQTAIGKSISFSDIIDAAREVVGVVSVAIVSPLFSVEHDQIKVQPYEKPFVLDLAQDVQVSFLGV